MLKSLVAQAGLFYLCNSPIARGKVRLARAIDPLTRGAPMKSPLGPMMSARLADTTFWLNMTSYQTFVEESLQGLGAGDVFIDIGANIGMFALVASQRVGPSGNVFAF